MASAKLVRFHGISPKMPTGASGNSTAVSTEKSCGPTAGLPVPGRVRKVATLC
jgi:hypothetical protein